MKAFEYSWSHLRLHPFMRSELQADGWCKHFDHDPQLQKGVLF